MRKISVNAAPEFEARGVAAEVLMVDQNGREFRAYCDPLVAPPIDVKKEKVTTKFMNLCGGSMGEKAATQAKDAILTMDPTSNMKKLIRRFHGTP